MRPCLRSSCGVLDLEETELTTRRGAGSKESLIPSPRTKGLDQCSVLTRIRLPSTGDGVLGLEISGVERAGERPKEFHRRTVLGFVPSVIGALTGFLRPSSSSSSSSSPRLWRRRRQKHRRIPTNTRAPIAPAKPPTMACLRELDMWIMSEEDVSVARDPMSVGRVLVELTVELENESVVEEGAKEIEPPIGS